MVILFIDQLFFIAKQMYNYYRHDFEAETAAHIYQHNKDRLGCGHAVPFCLLTGSAIKFVPSHRRKNCRYAIKLMYLQCSIGVVRLFAICILNGHNLPIIIFIQVEFSNQAQWQVTR